MKYVIIIICCLCFSLVQTQVIHASENAQIELIENLLEYLKRGNTYAVLKLFTEPILTEKKEQLENNRAYAKFARKIYADATLVIRNIVSVSATESEVDVEFLSPNGKRLSETRFILVLEEGLWKISSEKLLENSN